MVYRKTRPMRHEKVERNRELYQYHLDHPEATLGDMSEKFGGISRSRVGKLLKRIAADAAKGLTT